MCSLSMASTTLPSTPNRTALTVQRSFTLPPKLPYNRVSESDAAETLFTHHTARIVSFSPAPGDFSRRKSTTASENALTLDEEPVGVLPWASRTERTVAAGPIQVHRVPGSVAFLSSGRIRHPILAKSRCWCVDGESKFVLRIRSNSYYRIELPNECAEDKKISDNLKATLTQVLQFETTPCPFKRGFHVELPENPETPKRPWKPKHLPVLSPSSILDSLNDSECSSARSDLDGSSANSTDDEHLSSHSCKTSPSPSKLRPGQFSADQVLALETRPENVESMINVFEDLKSTPAGRVSMSADQPLQSTISVNHAELLDNDAEERTRNRPMALDCLVAATQGLAVAMSDTFESGTLEGQKGVEHPDQGYFAPKASALDPREGLRAYVTARCEHSAQGLSNEVDPNDVTVLVAPEAETQADTKARIHRVVRTVTAPPCLETKDLPREKLLMEAISTEIQDADTDAVDADTDAVSINSSLDSFYSLNSPASTCSLDPPFSNAHSSSTLLDETCLLQKGSHKHSVSQLTITPEPTATGNLTFLGHTEPTQTEGAARGRGLQLHGEAISNLCTTASSRNSSPGSTLRRRLQKRRTNSPLPSVANIYIPGVHISNHGLTAVVLQKTCSILLGPPVQLIALMLNIAQRIANNAIASENATHRANELPLPCSWDSDNETDNLGDEIWEDDYGLPLSGLSSLTEASRRSRQLDDNIDDCDVD